MGPAISTVTHLNINTSVIGSSEMEGVPVLLGLMACACPALHELNVSGNISRDVLAAFGSSCQSLSCLTLTHLTERSSTTLQQLHMLLPQLTCCRLLEQPITFGTADLCAQACCEALLLCTSLTHLDVGSCILTAETWSALPFGLVRLKCTLGRESSKEVNKPNSLHHLDVCCDARGCVDLRSLIAALCVAPQLQRLTLCREAHAGPDHIMPRIYVPCMIDGAPLRQIEMLMHLHNLVVAGLQVSSSLRVRDSFEGVTLSLGAGPDSDENRSVGEFLARLPPFPAFAGLVLNDRVDPYSEHLSLKGIATTFPNLTLFVVSTKNIQIADMEELGGLKLLKKLVLASTESLPDADHLDQLCTSLACLKELCLFCGAAASAEYTEAVEGIFSRVGPTCQFWNLARMKPFRIP